MSLLEEAGGSCKVLEVGYNFFRRFGGGGISVAPELKLEPGYRLSARPQRRGYEQVSGAAGALVPREIIASFHRIAITRNPCKFPRIPQKLPWLRNINAYVGPLRLPGALGIDVTQGQRAHTKPPRKPIYRLGEQDGNCLNNYRRVKSDCNHLPNQRVLTQSRGGGGSGRRSIDLNSGGDV